MTKSGLGTERFLLRSSLLGVLTLAFAPLASEAQEIVGSPVPRGTRLERNRVGSFPRRPFEWGRRAEFHRRTSYGVPGIAAENYDDGLARPSVSALSFYPPVSTPRAARGPQDAVPLERKYFQLNATTLAIGTLSLNRVGVTIDRTGRINASGTILSGGGPAGAWRGEKAIIEVRAISAPPEDRDATAGVVMWSKSQEVWVPRGELTTIDLLDRDCLTLEDRRILGESFDAISHVEVNLQTVEVR